MSIRRCPFCGSCEGPHLHPEGAYFAVECRNCGSAGSLGETESEAVAKWNVRRNHRVENAKRQIREFIRSVK